MRDGCRLEEAVVHIMFVETATDTVHVKQLQRLGAFGGVLARVRIAMVKHD